MLISWVLLFLFSTVSAENETDSEDRVSNAKLVQKARINILSNIFRKRLDFIKNETIKEVELIFLIDGSSSVGEDNFHNELKFVKKVIAGFVVGPEAARVSVIVFSSDIATYVNHLGDSLNHEKCSLLHVELPKIQYPGGNTFTLAALENAIVVLNKTRPNARKAVFLITDGFSNNGDPVPAAAQLKRTGVKLFTFGIKSGNVEELQRMSSPPSEEYCYLLESFLDFEALARRALHYDLPQGAYNRVSDDKLCSRLCDHDGGCCNQNATCTCGSFSGHFSCLCPSGYYGSGLAKEPCLPCPKGTYNEGTVPGDVSVCRPCPDRNQNTKKFPATTIDDCVCNEGFVPVGEKCVVVTCPFLEPPKNGYFVKEYCSNVLNAACGVRCDIGYVLSGSSVRICQKNGIWTGVEPKCVPKKCEVLKPVNNGEVVCSHEDEGFEVFIKYGENGEKKKEIMKTKPMEKLRNVTDGFIVDTECAFRCPEGFSLVGSKLRTCLPVTRWNGLQTACRQITCLSIPKISHGDIQPGNCTHAGVRHIYGSTCEISCNSGYILKGNQTLKCTERHGGWSGKSHSYKCVDIESPKFECPANMTLETDPGVAYATISNFSLPNATDNSHVDPILWSKPSLDDLPTPIGWTEVRIHGTDASGNLAICSFWISVQDTEPPIVENCQSPEAMTLEELLRLNWEEPTFSDNSGNVTVEKSQEVRGLANGTTTIIYTARDPSGNSAECALNLTLLDNTCTVPPIHRNTDVTCASNEAETTCHIFCKPGFTSNASNVTITCKNTQWNPENQQLPECTEAVSPELVIETGQIVLEGETKICDTEENFSLMTNHVIAGINETVNLKIECAKEGIEEESNSIWSAVRNRRFAKKIRRINILLTGSANGKTLKDIADDGKLWSYLGDDSSKKLQNLERILKCQLGSTPIGNSCAKCSVGTFFTAKSCVPCDVGFYQDKEGQLNCKSCPTDFSTLSNKSTSLSDCRKICRPGYSGLRVNINNLSLSPCRPCPPGQFQPKRGQNHCINCGKHCQKPEIECTSSICKNNGTCFADKFLNCLCADGYWGSFCDRSFNSCDSSPCLNGGSCKNLGPNSYSCQCQIGYQGKNCHVEIDPCLSGPCLNGGVCIKQDKSFSCECPSGFTGIFCGKHADPCALSKPCLNNGSCFPSPVGEFRCACVGEYSGRFCERFSNCLPEEEWFCSQILNHACIDDNCAAPVGVKITYSNKTVDLDTVLIFPKCSSTDYMMIDFEPELENVSACLWVQTADSFNFGTLFSYATRSNDNEFTLTDYNGFVLYVKGQRVVTDVVANDGQWHLVCVTWESKTGRWAVFLDGEKQSEGNDLGKGLPLSGAGKMVVGQEQDFLGGGFNEVESFVGKMTRIEMWPRILEAEEIRNIWSTCDEVSFSSGLRIWEQLLSNIHGNIQITSSHFCKNCGHPPSIFKASVNDKGSEAEYRCQDGFLIKFPDELTDTSSQYWTRKCLKTGEWEPNAPICTRVNCGVPGYFDHGTIIGRSHLYEDMIRYHCQENYTLIGSSSRKCQSNGQWSGETPICQGRGFCKLLSAPRRGSLFITYKSVDKVSTGDQAEFTCDDGYFLIGSSQLNCSPTGEWDYPEPICSLCPAILLSSDIKLEISNAKVYLRCLKTDDVVVAHCVMGSWDIPKKFCRDLKDLCPTPQPPKHGFWITHTRSIDDKFVGDSVQFSCRHGYQLIGSDRVECLPGKFWNISENSCEPVKCTEPGEPENAALVSSKGSYHYGNVLDFSCKPGFVRKGSMSIRCETNGQWSEVRGKCQKNLKLIVTMSRFDLQGKQIFFSDVNPFDRSYHKVQRAFDLEVVKLLAEIMNATTKTVINPLITNLMIYERNPNAWIVEQLIHGKAEISSTSLVLTPDSDNRVAYSVAINTFRPQIYFKEHSVRMANNIYYIPFSPDAWIALFCILLSITVVLTFILSRETRLPHSTPYDIIARIADEKHEKGINWDKINMKETPADNIKKREHWEISEILLVSIGALCQQGSERDPSTAAARTLLLALFALAVVTYTAYSASVISIISLLPNTEIEHHLGWAPARNSAIILEDTNFFKHSFDTSNQKVDFKGLEVGLEAALKGYAVFVADRDVSLTVLHQLRFGPELRCSLGRAFPGLEYQRVFALRRQSPYLQQTNYNILRLRQYGLLARERKRIFNRRLPCSPKERAALSGFISVDLSDTLPALKLLAIGCGLSVLIIITEVFVFYCSMEIKNMFGKSWQRVENHAGEILDRWIEENRKPDVSKTGKLVKPRPFLH